MSSNLEIGTLETLVMDLGGFLLNSEYGIDAPSYHALRRLVADVLGEDAANELDADTDSTDGYFYYPRGNEGEVRIPSMEDVAEALESRFIFESEDDEPDVDFYDDRAD